MSTSPRLTEPPEFQAHVAAAFLIVGLFGALVGVAFAVLVFRLVDAL